MSDWPHQRRAVEAVLAHVAAGSRRVLVTSPTGGGKTRIMQRLAEHTLARGQGVVLYSNRRLLVEQLSGAFAAAGVGHGVRAAGWEQEHDRLFQVASVQTEHARGVRGGRPLHQAQLVLIDEAHLQAGRAAQTVFQRHHDEGAILVGFTATPLDLGHCYDELVVAGNHSELRACGALVPAVTYGPDEPDLRRVKGIREGADLTEAQARKAMMTPGLFGRVWEWFGRLNPERRPTILFAPGVPESVWFAEQFAARGVSAAHIDGEDIWVDGRLHPSSRELRAEVLARSKAGDIVALCNRFVLREGIDCTWLAHGIFATVFGSLQSYLQSGGRLLRAHDGLDHVVVQDHGGNWWRHGSLNADREWRLEYTAAMAYGLRADALRGKKCRHCGAPLPGGSPWCAACRKANEVEPQRCPRCARVLYGRLCDPRFGGCGWEASKKSRPVVMTDGTLKEMTGDAFRPRRLSVQPDGPQLWERMVYRSRTAKGAKTFRQAMALFAHENNWAWPDPTWPLMPRDPLDFYRLVADVPPDRLIPKGSGVLS